MELIGSSLPPELLRHTIPENRALVSFRMIDHALKDPHCPLDNGKHKLNPKFSLGRLDRLPAELLENVLINLDLRTLTDFRRVNQRAMQCVDYLPKYNAIFKNIPKVLKGILSVKSGRFITCEELYNRLCDGSCQHCGDFGGYLYIITAKRLCLICFATKEEYIPLEVPDLKVRLSISLATPNSVPRIRSIPGMYALNDKKCRKRRTLIDYSSAKVSRSAVPLKPDPTLRQNPLPTATLGEMYFEGHRYLCLPEMWNFPSKGRYHVNQFMSIIRMPWLNIRGQRLEFGVNCLACFNFKLNRFCTDMDAKYHWSRKFTDEGFAAHIKECGPITDEKHDTTGILPDPPRQ